MFNQRVDFQIFPFFDSVAHPVSETGESDSFRNNGYGSMRFEIGGNVSAVSLQMEGFVNILSDEGYALPDSDVSWTPLILTNTATGALVTSADAKGAYMVDISGLGRVRCKLTSISGEATIVGIITR